MTRWIAADWGNSHLRVWVMEGEDVIATPDPGPGAAALSGAGFEAALLSVVAPYLSDDTQTPVIACGAIGAREGWCEVPYRPAPAPPPGFDGARSAPCRDRRIAVHILPGMSLARPAAVMRGEETQTAGFLAAHDGWDGVLCLPGTHSVWVHVSAGEVVSFRSFLTGEMFDLLSTRSVLRHTVAGDAALAEAAFLEAVSDAMSRPERLSGDLFSLRAEALLHGLDPAQARARLSGLLIGQELAAARPYWLGQRVAILGAGPLAEAYDAALRPQGVLAERADLAEMTLRGLIAAYRGMQTALAG